MWAVSRLFSHVKALIIPSLAASPLASPQFPLRLRRNDYQREEAMETDSSRRVKQLVKSSGMVRFTLLRADSRCIMKQDF